MATLSEFGPHDAVDDAGAARPTSVDPDEEALRGLLELAALVCGGVGARICAPHRSTGAALPFFRGTDAPDRTRGVRLWEQTAAFSASPSAAQTGAGAGRHEIAVPIRADDGTLLGALCVAMDGRARTGPETARGLALVAGRIAREVALGDALERQDALARETDHRVKNALQSVASFLRLQQRRAGEAGVGTVLSLAARHVSAIALLHEEMSTGHPGTVALHDYMARLGPILASATPGEVDVTVSFEPAWVAFEQAAALAAIANEFVANAVKHAFPAGRAGHVAVDGTVGADGSVTVALTDDGVGPSTAGGGQGLGMRIMKASAQKLGGELTLSPPSGGSGFSVSVRFAPSVGTGCGTP